MIPAEIWSMDYVTPKHFCTAKDGVCAPSHFSKDRPEVSRHYPVTGNKQQARPSYLVDPKIKVLHLTPGYGKIAVKDVKAGRYHVIMHYYQPNNPSFEGRFTCIAYLNYFAINKCNY